MLTQDRYRAILDLLEEKNSVTVSELTKLLDSSESTIRRDLSALDEMGKLTKVFGGATSITRNEGVFEDAVSNRETVKKMRLQNTVQSLSMTLTLFILTQEQQH